MENVICDPRDIPSGDDSSVALAAVLSRRLAEAQSLLEEEKASKQALQDELTQMRAGLAGTTNFTAQDHGGSSDGKDIPHLGSPPPAAGGAEGESERSWSGGRRRGTWERPPWKNGLYKRQPYADNHVPESFLEKLVTNGKDVKHIDAWSSQVRVNDSVRCRMMTSIAHSYRACKGCEYDRFDPPFVKDREISKHC